MENDKNSILIVDDDTVSIWPLSVYLEDDYKIYSAENGQDAINAAEKYLPDLILLDLILPGIDGYALITQLKKSIKTQNIPVIFITSFEQGEEKGLSLGASDYITKPFNLPIVKHRIDNQMKILHQLRAIESLSLTDHLTGLPNRRSFDLRLQMEWSRVGRENSPLSILIIDVNKFKYYNDSFGHQQGDLALQAIGNAFRDVLKRDSDFASRWGGDEFVVLLPNTDSKGAMKVREKIRKHIEAMEVPCSNKLAMKITVSIGINIRLPEHDNSIEDFILGADMALYDAKHSGKDRVSTYNSTEGTQSVSY